MGGGLGHGQAIVAGAYVVPDDLHIGGGEEPRLPPAVLPLQPPVQLLLAVQSHHLILGYGDLPWVLRVEVVQNSGLQRHSPLTFTPVRPLKPPG